MNNNYFLEHIYCPFLPRMNPLIGDAQAHNLKWVQHYHLLQFGKKSKGQYLSEKYSLIAGRVFPEVNIEQLNLATDWVSFLTSMDDILDDHLQNGQQSYSGLNPHRLTQEFTNVVQGKSVDSSGSFLGYALKDIISRLSNITTDFWLQRFKQNVLDYMQAMTWEQNLSKQGVPPSLSTYEKLRSYTFSAGIAFVLMGAFHRFDRTQFIDLIYVKQLENFANHFSAWTNDLLGIGNETNERNYHNIVFVVKHQFQLNLREAVAYVIERINSEMESFIQLEKQLPHLWEACHYQEEIQAYIHSLKYWMRGHVDWTLESKRYHKAFEDNLHLLAEKNFTPITSTVMAKISRQSKSVKKIL